MMRTLLALLLATLSTALAAQTPGVPSAMAGLSFLVGDWAAGEGQVAETGGTSRGRSTIMSEAGGNILLRKDHTDLFDASGKSTGSFDQIMMIYPEAGTIHADYADGAHVIHYDHADVTAGRSATFTSARRPDAPTFRLSYELTDPRTLAVTFQMAPPGSADFHPIATGSLKKAG